LMLSTRERSRIPKGSEFSNQFFPRDIRRHLGDRYFLHL
jgi:hypothetical protein